MEPRIWHYATWAPKNLQQLLSLYNQSWQMGRLDASWKNARIVAILNPEKPATDIGHWHCNGEDWG